MSISSIFLFLVKVIGVVTRGDFHRSTYEFCFLSLLSFGERVSNNYPVNVGRIRFEPLKVCFPPIRGSFCDESN